MRNKEKNRKAETIQKKREPIIFMNTPISSPEEDVVGFSVHVDNLDAAITKGAQMIALTSPFGTGKTSITELLQAKYAKDKRKRVIRVPMWSQLSNSASDADNKTTELHRSFVYQLISQINYRKGVYISKRLNPSYGLLKLHTEKTVYWFLTVVAAICAVAGYVLPEMFEFSLPLFGENADNIEKVLIFIALGLFVFVVSSAEIVFSSNKSEGGRKIDTNEIVQIYRAHVLVHKRRWWHWVNNKAKRIKSKLVKKILCFLLRTSSHYIIVIEDLDRTNDDAAVVSFLKELRKYYIPEAMNGESAFYFNSATFIITVKPEPLLLSNADEIKQNKEKEGEAEAGKTEGAEGARQHERLYAKLFDYILNLQTINIDNYQAILEGLLKEKKDLISALELTQSDTLLDVPGMFWIVHGKRLGIREIKDRLNIAFSLYESLCSRFEPRDILFEKCAVVAYVTTEFEEDFYKTGDQAFQSIVEGYLQGHLDDSFPKAYLPNTNDEYCKAIKELVEAKHIDSNYRMYFYNYPTGGRIYTLDEQAIQRAILYGEHSEKLSQHVERAIAEGSRIIIEAFQTRIRLGLPLPDVVFEIEKLYTQAVQHVPDKVLEWIDSLDYKQESRDKTIARIIQVLKLDSTRVVYTKSIAASFCKKWEDKFAEAPLLQLRKALCTEFSKEILWYKDLFFGVHNLVTTAELDNLDLADAIQLVNTNHDSFSEDMLMYLSRRFDESSDVSASSPYMYAFLKEAAEYIDTIELPLAFSKYMTKVEQIVPEFESAVFSYIKNATGEERERLFASYQELINLMSSAPLSNATLQNISRLHKYDGYVEAVADQMDNGKYVLDFLLLCMHQCRRIPFEREDVACAIREEIEWLRDDMGFFLPLRKLMVGHDTCVFRTYAFMFGEDCPIITEEELGLICHYKTTEKEILSLIPASLVTEDEIPMLKKHFCRTRHQPTASFEILLYVASLESQVSRKLFYELDFDLIAYRRVSGVRKERIKKAFMDTLSLNVSEEKLKFMRVTNYLDPNWEIQLQKELMVDDDLQSQYIDTVNSVNQLSSVSMQILSSLPHYPMNERITEEFFNQGLFTAYVSSKTQRMRTFEVEDGERGKILWPVYLQIYGGDGFQTTKKYMNKNLPFLEAVMNSKAYEQMPNKNIMGLSAVSQSKECIEYVFDQEGEFASQYLSKIAGFRDLAAATTFVECIQQNAALLRSKQLYAHTHKLLPNGKLKAKYTRTHKKQVAS